MITYLELLELLKEGKQPEKIKYLDIVYTFYSYLNCYVDEDNTYLSAEIANVYSDVSLVNDAIIEVVEE